MEKKKISLLTTKEAAAHISLSPATLEKWRSKGIGPHFFRVGSKSIRYRQSDLDAFLSDGGRYEH